jgi:uracil-DNA glycosylase family 4
MGEGLNRGTCDGARCEECPFSTHGGPTRPVFSEYPDDPLWILISEGPGFHETKQGRPFIGASGQVVNQILHKIGRPRDHLFVGYATLCQPPQGSPVEERERAAACCKPRLAAELAQFPGKPVLTLGAVAARAIIPQESLDAIDPPDVPKTRKKSQKEKQKAASKDAKAESAAIEKIAARRFKKLLKIRQEQVKHECIRIHKRKPSNWRQYLEKETERDHKKLWIKATADANVEYHAKQKEKELAKQAKVGKKPTKKKPIKITDIVGTLFDVDVDGSGVRPVIPAIHPAALLRGGGATIGGSHTPDMAFINLIYDAGKVDALGKGRDIRLKLDVEYELTDPERAAQLMLNILQDAIDDNQVTIDLETYVDDVDRHHALMAYVAKIRVIGISSKRRRVSVLWDLLPNWCFSYLQLVLGNVPTVYHNALYDRTVLRAYGFVLPSYGVDEHAQNFEDCYIESETEFLTQLGWKKYEDVKAGTLLATVNQAGQLEWQSFFSRTSRHYQGEALIFETNHTRAVVTPNHRMWCQPLRRTSKEWRGKPMAPWGFTKAADMLNSSTDSYAVQQACEPPKMGKTPELAKLQLMGLWLADGALSYYNGKPRSIMISQARDGHASKLLRHLAKTFEFTMREHLHDDEWRNHPVIEEIWDLSDPAIAEEFALLGRHSRSRKLPADAFQWSQEARETFLEALFLGDGSEHGGRAQRFVYRSGSEALADGVQALALSIGWSATNPKTYRPDDICHVFISRSVPISVPIRTRLAGANSKVTKIEVDDHIVCFSVPNETLITRSRGKPAFYGNTLLAHHAAFPGNAHRLQNVVSQFFGAGPWKAEFRNQEETLDKLAVYNGLDTGGTQALVAPLMHWIRKTKTERIYELDKRMSDIASRMHLAGIPIDREVNSQLVRTFTRLAKDSRAAVEAQARDPKTLEAVRHHLALQLAQKKRKADSDDFETRYNTRLDDTNSFKWNWKINNSKHISSLLQAMGVPLIQVTEGGAISTKKSVLESLVDHSIVQSILTYRQNNKMLDFVWPIFDRIDGDKIIQHGFADENDRIHPIWSIHKISGRWASSEPFGISNAPREKTKKVPIETKLHKDTIITKVLCKVCEKVEYEHKNSDHKYIAGWIEYAERPTTKRQVVARPGRKLVGFDFAQIEARILALISGDEFMCEVFGRDGDLHTECARVVFAGFDGKTASERKMARTVCKTLEYATWYGASDDKVWKGLLQEGYKFKFQDVVGSLNVLRKKMQGIVRWQRETIQMASQPPYELRDFVGGRRRVWPMGQVEASEALSIVPQSTGAAIMNIGMFKMDQRLVRYKEAFCIAQIHDAAVFECWADDAEAVKQDIIECFTYEHTNEANGQTVKFLVEVDIGQAWSDI